MKRTAREKTFKDEAQKEQYLKKEYPFEWGRRWMIMFFSFTVLERGAHRRAAEIFAL
jgi:hypothetical protein